jgi:predicted nucleic acid-binding protein
MPDAVLSVIKEDPVLECAVSAEAKHIVSGDRHLVKLGLYVSTQIISVRQFMDLIKPEP